MEDTALVLQGLSVVNQISSAESHKVLHSFGHNVSEEVNDDISGGSVSNVNAEGDLVSRSFLSEKVSTDSSLANATATRSSRTRFFIINNDTYIFVAYAIKQTHKSS